MDGLIIILVLTAIMLPVNFLPTIVARCRRHRYRLAITVMNVLVFIFSTIFVFAAPALCLVLFAVWCWAHVWACTPNIEAAAEGRA